VGFKVDHRAREIQNESGGKIQIPEVHFKVAREKQNESQKESENGGKIQILLVVGFQFEVEDLGAQVVLIKREKDLLVLRLVLSHAQRTRDLILKTMRVPGENQEDLLLGLLQRHKISYQLPILQHPKRGLLDNQKHLKLHNQDMNLRNQDMKLHNQDINLQIKNLQLKSLPRKIPGKMSLPNQQLVQKKKKKKRKNLTMMASQKL